MPPSLDSQLVPLAQQECQRRLGMSTQFVHLSLLRGLKNDGISRSAREVRTKSAPKLIASPPTLFSRSSSFQLHLSTTTNLTTQLLYHHYRLHTRAKMLVGLTYDSKCTFWLTLRLPKATNQRYGVEYSSSRYPLNVIGNARPKIASAHMMHSSTLGRCMLATIREGDRKSSERRRRLAR